MQAVFYRRRINLFNVVLRHLSDYILVKISPDTFNTCSFFFFEEFLFKSPSGSVAGWQSEKCIEGMNRSKGVSSKGNGFLTHGNLFMYSVFILLYVFTFFLLRPLVFKVLFKRYSLLLNWPWQYISRFDLTVV